MRHVVGTKIKLKIAFVKLFYDLTFGLEDYLIKIVFKVIIKADYSSIKSIIVTLKCIISNTILN